MPIEYMFCFICSKQCIKIISSRKKSGLLSSVFKKIFLITLRLLFKKWVGYLNPSHFVDGIITSHLIALTITPLIDFYSQGIFTFLFATVFNGNEPESQLIAKLTLPHRKIIRVISPFFRFTKFVLVSIQKA